MQNPNEAMKSYPPFDIAGAQVREADAIAGALKQIADSYHQEDQREFKILMGINPNPYLVTPGGQRIDFKNKNAKAPI